jgi:hypothetical protein
LCLVRLVFLVRASFSFFSKATLLSHTWSWLEGKKEFLTFLFPSFFIFPKNVLYYTFIDGWFPVFFGTFLIVYHFQVVTQLMSFKVTQSPFSRSKRKGEINYFKDTLTRSKYNWSGVCCRHSTSLLRRKMCRSGITLQSR